MYLFEDVHFHDCFVLVSISDLSTETAINANDIVSTFQALGMLKYWKGKHLVLKKQVWNVMVEQYGFRELLVKCSFQ